jgi:hypothetical protein
MLYSALLNAVPLVTLGLCYIISIVYALFHNAKLTGLMMLAGLMHWIAGITSWNCYCDIYFVFFWPQFVDSSQGIYHCMSLYKPSMWISHSRSIGALYIINLADDPWTHPKHTIRGTTWTTTILHNALHGSWPWYSVAQRKEIKNENKSKRFII